MSQIFLFSQLIRAYSKLRLVEDLPPAKRKREDAKPFQEYRAPRRLSNESFPNPRESPSPPEPTIWMENNALFIGFNTRRFEVPPRATSTTKPSWTEWNKISWERAGFPYLAFLELRPSCRGSLLHRLAISKACFPLKERSGNLVGLDPLLIESWIRFEINIKH